MFLSKVSLAAGGDGHLALLRMQRNGSYAAHQLLWQLFSIEAQRSFLFRHESMPQGSIFYVLSESKPEQRPGLVVQTKALQPKLYKGQRLAFSLRANPTVHFDNKRHDVLMHAKRQAKEQGITTEQCWPAMEQAARNWLCAGSRMERWGVRIATQPVVESYIQHQSKKKPDHNIRYSSVDYQGILSIVDVDRFWRQYCRGFGRAKALGCGLMLIRPA